MPGFDLIGWGGLSGPAGLPREAVAKLEAAVAKALQDPEIQKRFAAAGIERFWAGQEEFTDYVRRQLVNWTALIKETGIEPQ
jgi:tripartite-type tricarboxylate transporter receptor subunit TctC